VFSRQEDIHRRFRALRRRRGVRYGSVETSVDLASMTGAKCPWSCARAALEGTSERRVVVSDFGGYVSDELPGLNEQTHTSLYSTRLEPPVKVHTCLLAKQPANISRAVADQLSRARESPSLRYVLPNAGKQDAYDGMDASIRLRRWAGCRRLRQPRRRVPGLQSRTPAPRHPALSLFVRRGPQPRKAAPPSYPSKHRTMQDSCHFLIWRGTNRSRPANVTACRQRETPFARYGIERARAVHSHETPISFIVIGPVVAAELESLGIRVDAMPEDSYSMKPLVKSVCELLGGGR
jgi:hypothetical protein